MEKFSPENEKSIQASSRRASFISFTSVVVAVVGFSAFFIGRFSVETVTEIKQAAPVENAIPVKAPVNYRECRLPEHGVESWGEIQRWSVDSGWRKGGSNPTKFCDGQKSQREKQFPEREVNLLSTGEKHKSEYTPFKHDYYRYSCEFEDRWNPIYNLRENTNCEHD